LPSRGREYLTGLVFAADYHKNSSWQWSEPYSGWQVLFISCYGAKWSTANILIPEEFRTVLRLMSCISDMKHLWLMV
jgi:hypothetical protein